MWVRYVEWCSTKVSHRISSMSPGDIWALAETLSPPDRAHLFASPPSGSSVLVQELILAVFRQMELPEYRVWAAGYQADPDSYDRWISSLEETRLGEYSVLE